jgi:hypothetical protein
MKESVFTTLLHYKDLTDEEIRDDYEVKESDTHFIIMDNYDNYWEDYHIIQKTIEE